MMFKNSSELLIDDHELIPNKNKRRGKIECKTVLDEQLSQLSHDQNENDGK